MKYHLLLSTFLSTTSQQQSDRVDFLLRFAQFQTVNEIEFVVHIGI